MAEGDSPVVVINLSADSTEFQNQLKQIEGMAKRSGDKAGNSVSDGVKSGFSSLKTWAVGIGASLIAGITFKKIIDEAAASDEAVMKFNNSLALSGRFSKGASDDFQNFASQIQNTTRIADEAVLGVGSLLNSYLNLDQNGLKRATKATIDFAAQTGKGVEESAMLLVRAVNGGGASLSKYGIELNGAKDKTVLLNNALTGLETRFGGSAAAQINTFSGAMARTKNMFDDVFESIGKNITQSPQVIELIKIAGDKLRDMASAISTIDVGAIISNLIEFGKAVNMYVVAPLELVFNISKIAFQALVVGVDTIVAAFGKLGGAIGWVAEKLGMGGEVTQALSDFSESSSEVLNEEFENLGVTMADALSFPIANATDTVLTDIQTRVENAKPVVTENLNQIGKTAKTISVEIGAALAGGIAKGVQGMTAALMAGKASLANFGKMFLGIMGDMATQVGMTLLTTGIGMMALGSLNPAGAIAAGVGLIAIGQILKSMSGGGDTAAANAPMGGGAGIAGEGGGPVTASAERALPNTNVQVVVQGDILDSAASGSRIIDMLNSSFEKTGQTLVRGAMA